MKRCRYDECFKPQHRFGLCNKHRKWVERGYMTQDLVLLKKVPERGKYKYANCLIEGCADKPRRNDLCSKHSSMKLRGTLTLGDAPNPKARRFYPPDFECIVCGKRGKIVKGFCRLHYAHLKKGIIDYDGQPLSAPKRVVRYEPGDVCRASMCGKKPRVRGWCNVHWVSFDRGIYDKTGKRLVPPPTVNLGARCKECDEPAHCKGLCVLHYSRLKSGYLGPEGYKNVGKKCTALGCSAPAHCRTLCVKHYRRHLDRERASARAKQKEIIPVKMPPVL